EPITPQISDRICKHMNEDHAEAIVLYAQVFGSSPEAEAAKLKAIDPQGMDIITEVKGESVPVRVSFATPLKDAEDAHHTLIEMLKQARKMKN
ncbi:MAG: DUF2470 domain-containing protein, partial [Spirulinaceae cyanobacterium]